MAATLAPEDYKELILFLATAGLVVPVFHRLRVSPVLGFIGAGALLGPHGLGRLVGEAPWLSWVTISNPEEISHFAEFGVVFLLFMIGLELSWRRLWTLRRLVFGLGPLQVGLCALAIGGIASRFGADPLAATLLGVALALSSTAIVVPVLAGHKRLNLAAGRTSFPVLLFQDLAVAPVLFAIAVLASGRTEDLAASFLWALAQAGVAITGIVGVGRIALRPLFQLVATTRSPELFMAACLLVVLATGLVAALSGLSMGLGALIAGLLLAETEYRRAIEVMVDPFKGLLLGVFFVSVGMSLDLTRLAQDPAATIAAALGLIALKAAVVTGLAPLFRLPLSVAVETALLLGPGGEFAFVLLGSAMAAGLVAADLGQTGLLVATLSMLAIPGLARLGARLSGRLERARAAAGAPPEPPPPDEASRVIVAGFGRVGQLIGEMLARHDVPYIAVDLDPDRVAEQRRAGKPVYFGDSALPDFLRACGIERARALAVTLDSPKAVEAVVAAARGERPDLTIVARARDARHAMQLYELGVDDAVPETIEASLQLSEAVLVDIGVPMGLVIASVHERRDEFRRALMRTEEPPGKEGSAFQGRRSPHTARGA